MESDPSKDMGHDSFLHILNESGLGAREILVAELGGLLRTHPKLDAHMRHLDRVFDGELGDDAFALLGRMDFSIVKQQPRETQVHVLEYLKLRLGLVSSTYCDVAIDKPEATASKTATVAHRHSNNPPIELPNPGMTRVVFDDFAFFEAIGSDGVAVPKTGMLNAKFGLGRPGQSKTATAWPVAVNTIAEIHFYNQLTDDTA